MQRVDIKEEDPEGFVKNIAFLVPHGVAEQIALCSNRLAVSEGE
jgi:hypothetical protein